MLRMASELEGYRVRATDGDVGDVADFYFDDESWKLRYLVVDTGGWLGRRVLIAPDAFEQPDWGLRAIGVSLTRVQVKNSPDVDTDRPISRQKELEYRLYYDWPVYWRDALVAGPGLGVYPGMPTYPAARATTHPEAAAAVERQGNEHLRSARDVRGHHVQASDGEIGHVDDYILDDEGWSIRYLVLDRRNWLPGSSRVLVSPDWVSGIDWSESKVYVNVTREQVKKAPDFDPSKPVNRDYEHVLYDYYGRPAYWDSPSR